MGRPLYPQLSGHCNRPLPRDSRVFTRRLTPNLGCSHSHTKSTSKLQENNHKTRRLQNNYSRSYSTSLSQSNTLYKYTQTTQGRIRRQTTILYESVHHNTKRTQYRQLKYTPVKQKRTQVQATVAHAITQGHVRTEDDVKHNYTEANV